MSAVSQDVHKKGLRGIMRYAKTTYMIQQHAPEKQQPAKDHTTPVRHDLYR
jgi:hypothetical protein